MAEYKGLDADSDFKEKYKRSKSSNSNAISDDEIYNSYQWIGAKVTYEKPPSDQDLIDITVTWFFR